MTANQHRTILAPSAPWPYRPAEPKEIKWKYGTGKRGLTDSQVIEVRLARTNKVSYRLLEARYKIGRKALSEAVHGRGTYAVEVACGTP